MHEALHPAYTSMPDLLDGSYAHELALEQLLTGGPELGRRLNG